MGAQRYENDLGLDPGGMFQMRMSRSYLMRLPLPYDMSQVWSRYFDQIGPFLFDLHALTDKQTDRQTTWQTRYNDFNLFITTFKTRYNDF